MHTVLAVAAAALSSVCDPGLQACEWQRERVTRLLQRCAGACYAVAPAGSNGCTSPPASLGRPVRHSALFGMIQADRVIMVHALPQAA